MHLFFSERKHMRFRTSGPSLALVTALALSSLAQANDDAVANNAVDDVVDAATSADTEAQDDTSRGDVIIVTARRLSPASASAPRSS